MLISVQTGDVVDDLGFETGYKLLKDLGYEAVDWNIDHGWNQRDIANGIKGNSIFDKDFDTIIAYYHDELEIIKKNGLVITQAHAPFPCYVFEHPDILDYAIEIYKNCIKLCDYAGCRNLIIHGHSASPNHPEMTLDDVKAVNMKLYSSLIDTLKDTNVTVCLENLFTSSNGKIYEGTCSDPHVANWYIDTLNEMAGKEAFGLCLDIGHLCVCGKNATDYIRTVNKRIVALHIHDNDGIHDQHLMPFTGIVRWNDVITALKEIGYDHDLSFETFAQVRKNRMDSEFIEPYLRCIEQVGEIFRKRIQG